MSRPLGSTATPASSGFTATTGRSASERRDWYSVPSVSAVGRLPLATTTTSVAVSTLAFSRSVQEPQTRLTPPLRRTPPGQQRGHPPGSSRGATKDPRFRCRLTLFDASTAHARPGCPGPSASGTSSWSPPDPVTPGLFPGRSPRQSSANAAPGRFDAYPRRADAGGPTSLHLSHSTAYVRVFLHDTSFSVRDALVAALEQLACECQAGAVAAEPLGRLHVVVAVW